jgi:chemotaxis protein MotA
MSGSALIDPLALLLVVGGALLLAFVQSGAQASRQAGLAMFTSRADLPDSEAAAARRLIHAASAAISHRGLFAAETLAPRHRYLRAALAELADAHDPALFASAIAQLSDAEDRQSRAAAAFWMQVADAAPALGMIGTVVGMIRMAAHMGDPALVGPALAVALTSTLYGLIVSACLAAPAAQRLFDRADAAARWRTDFARALDLLLRRERNECRPATARAA